MNEYCSITEFASKINMSNNETYKLLKNNFNNHLKTIDGIVSIKKKFINNFLSLNEINKNNDFKSAELLTTIEEKNKKIEELEKKLLFYSDKAFELAETALNIQQQTNYITASKEINKKNIFQRLLKK